MFRPKRVIFEKKALDYEAGRSLLENFKKEKIDIIFSNSGRVTQIPGKEAREMYLEGKNTLVVGVRKALKFESCKPSANYQLPLVSGCMGMCEYCYLNTQMGKKPYIKIYANTNEILMKAKEYIKEREPEVTVFEGAATSDPIPVEGYSKALRTSIEFFGKEPNARFRFVTKYSDVDSLLDLNHGGNTTVRFSINTPYVINQFEKRTELIENRLKAALKVYEAGYKVGFIIAPVFLYEGWKEDYKKLINNMYNMFKGKNISFEVISHRFTKRAKENILLINPNSELPMNEEERKFKFGQFGYGKYVYEKDQLEEMKEFFKERLSVAFGDDCIDYII